MKIKKIRSENNRSNLTKRYGVSEVILHCYLVHSRAEKLEMQLAESVDLSLEESRLLSAIFHEPKMRKDRRHTPMNFRDVTIKSELLSLEKRKLIARQKSAKEKTPYLVSTLGKSKLRKMDSARKRSMIRVAREFNSKYRRPMRKLICDSLWDLFLIPFIFNKES